MHGRSLNFQLNVRYISVGYIFKNTAKKIRRKKICGGIDEEGIKKLAPTRHFAAGWTPIGGESNRSYARPRDLPASDLFRVLQLADGTPSLPRSYLDHR